jgi:hypothetical protein
MKTFIKVNTFYLFLNKLQVDNADTSLLNSQRINRSLKHITISKNENIDTMFQ